MDTFFLVTFERWEPFLASNSICLKSNDGAVVGHFLCRPIPLFRYSAIPLFCYSVFRVLKTPLSVWGLAACSLVTGSG